MAIQWYISNTYAASGPNPGRTAISGATSSTYSPVLADVGKYLERQDGTLLTKFAKPVKVKLPFETLKNIIAEWDFEAMEPGTYTTIPDVSGNQLPLTMGLGTSITIADNAGRREAVFDGTKTLRQLNKAFLKRLHDGTVKWTIMIECRIGNTTNPDAAYGLVGNNAGTSGNPGFSIWADNRTSVPAVRNFRFLHSKVGAPANLDHTTTQVVNYNKSTFIFLSFVPSKTQDDNTTQFNNLVLFCDGLFEDVNTVAGTSYSSANATYDFEIGACGNGVIPFTGGINRIVIWQDELSVKDRQLLQASKVWTPNATSKRTIEPRVRDILDENDYILGSAIAKNPVNGKIISLFQRTRSHFEIGTPCDIYKRTSEDNGLSWSDMELIWNDDINKKHVHCVYLSSGRLVALYTEFSRTTAINPGSPLGQAGIETGWYSRYSDDDGATWSAKTAIGNVPAHFVRWTNHDTPIIASNGDILACAYGFQWSGGAMGTNKGVSLLRSTDGGLTFNVSDQVYLGTTYMNESSVVETSSGKLFVFSRNEANSGNFSVFSNVSGSWVNHGLLSVDGTTGWYHPPMVRKFTLSGQSVIALYFLNRTQHRHKVVYLRASDLETNNIAAFTGKTRFTMSLFPDREYSGYMNLIQDGLGGVGAYSNEKGPTSASTVTSMRSELVYFTLPTKHQATIISELSL